MAHSPFYFFILLHFRCEQMYCRSHLAAHSDADLWMTHTLPSYLLIYTYLNLVTNGTGDSEAVQPNGKRSLKLMRKKGVLPCSPHSLLAIQ